MKRSKAIFIPIIAVAGFIGFILTYIGCVLITDAIEYPYTFWHPSDQIEKVEICYYNYEADFFSSIKTLSDAEQKSILSDIPRLTHQRVFGGRGPDYGKVVVYITYKDHSAECIGIWGNGRMDPNGKWRQYSDCFEEDEFSQMILKYVDEYSVPADYREWAAGKE